MFMCKSYTIIRVSQKIECRICCNGCILTLPPAYDSPSPPLEERAGERRPSRRKAPAFGCHCVCTPLPAPTAVELRQKGSAAWLLPLPAERGEGSVLAPGVHRQENSLGPPLPSPLLPWGSRGRSRRLLRGKFPNSTAVLPGYERGSGDGQEGERLARANR